MKSTCIHLDAQAIEYLFELIADKKGILYSDEESDNTGELEILDKIREALPVR